MNKSDGVVDCIRCGRCYSIQMVARKGKRQHHVDLICANCGAFVTHFDIVNPETLSGKKLK